MVAHAVNSSTHKVGTGESEIKVFSSYVKTLAPARGVWDLVSKKLTYKYNRMLGIEVMVQV